jgi:hypothetical protein
MKEGIHMKKNHLAIWVTAALLSLPFSSAFAADAADATAPAMEQGMQQGQMPEGQPPEGMMPPGGFNPPGEVTQGTSANTISKNETVKGAVYMSKGDNENALRITGADVSLDRIVAEKISGATSNTEAGDFYGQNAALLATDGAKVSLKNSFVTSNAQNGNGVFSYGKGTKVYVEDTVITTHKDNSGGIQTTGGGYTEARNLTIVTEGNSSAAIRSDRGGGTVIVKGGSFKTGGSGSPAIYSTADIRVEGADLLATSSEGAVIEGKNSISLKDSTLDGHMNAVCKMGDRTMTEENVHTVMIYQSMSGDAEKGRSDFSMEGSTLHSRAGDVIYVTNTDCNIKLKDTEITSDDADGALLRVVGNSASRGWGKKGTNGGNADVLLENEKIKGNIIADDISMLNLTLKNTRWTGALSIDKNAAATDPKGTVNVKIDEGSSWALTGDSTVTTLENHGTILKNGHTLTVLKA